MPAAEAVLALDPAELKSADRALRLYDCALAPRKPSLKRAALALWTVVGISGLIVLAWAEPFSAALIRLALSSGLPPWLAGYVLVPLVMSARAVLIVEAFGYAYHRFFQHLGFLTRQAAVFRRNQRFHWIHHMILYPIGRFYRRDIPYVASERGIAWSWAAPAVLAFALALATLGPRPGTFIFIGAMAAYAKFVVDRVHDLFHETGHPWEESRYFQRLEDIHLLHHWDQSKNFTIVHPAMDWLFGTYLAPSAHRRELQAAREDKEMSVSDLVNWRYLLLEATPAEHAAFISEARRHPRSLRKLAGLLEVLGLRLERFPSDALALELRRRAQELLALVRREPVAGGLNLLKSL